METREKFVIVGGGAIGLATALALLRLGHEVVLLERARRGVGASAHNAGWIVPTMSEPVPSPGALVHAARWLFRRDRPLSIAVSTDIHYLTFLARMLTFCSSRAHDAGAIALSELSRGAFDGFDALKRDGIDFEEHRAGVLYALRSDDAAMSLVSELDRMAPSGTAVPQVLADSALHELEPALNHRLRVGVLCPEERHVNPSSFIMSMWKACASRGGVLREGIHVTQIQDLGGMALVTTSTGETLRADRVVVAAGAASGSIAGLEKLRQFLQSGRGYGIDVPLDKPVVGRPIYLSDDKIAVSPFCSSLRVAGIMEFVPAMRAPRNRADILKRVVARSLTGVPLEKAESWSASRPMTPDGLPMLGFLPGSKAIAVAAGHAMLGITLAPVTGSAMAELVIGGEPELSLTAFDPARFLKK